MIVHFPGDYFVWSVGDSPFKYQNDSEYRYFYLMYRLGNSILVLNAIYQIQNTMVKGENWHSSMLKLLF